MSKGINNSFKWSDANGECWGIAVDNFKEIGRRCYEYIDKHRGAIVEFGPRPCSSLRVPTDGNLVGVGRVPTRVSCAAVVAGGSRN